MHHRDGPVRAHRIPHPAHVGQPHRGIDHIPGVSATTPQPRQREADRSRVDARDGAGALGDDLQPHRRLREVPIVALDEIGRSAECGDHAGEALGRGPGGERPIRLGDGLGVIAGQAAQDEHLGREGARHRV